MAAHMPDEPPRRLSPSVRVALVVVGVAVALVIAWTSTHRGETAWSVWALAAVGLGGTSGAVLGLGLDHHARLVRRPAVTRRGVRRYVYGFVVLVAASSGVSALVRFEASDGPTGADVRAGVLILVAVVCALPVVACLGAVREAARGAARPGTGVVQGGVPQAVQDVLDLRGECATLLAAAGAQVALAVLAAGAAMRMSGPIDSAELVVFGLAWSLTIAVTYAPAASAVQARGRAVVDVVAPLGTAPDDEVVARLDTRASLAKHLGVDQGVFGEVRAGLVVASPLLAAAVTTFVG